MTIINYDDLQAGNVFQLRRSKQRFAIVEGGILEITRFRFQTSEEFFCELPDIYMQQLKDNRLQVKLVGNLSVDTGPKKNLPRHQF